MNTKHLLTRYAITGLIALLAIAGLFSLVGDVTAVVDRYNAKITEPIFVEPKPFGHDEISLVEEYRRDQEKFLWENLTFAIWCEAREGQEEEMRSVASVKYHRAREQDWDYHSVIHAPRQFSCMGSDGHSPVNQVVRPADQEAYDVASQIAIELLQGTFEPMFTANHYYAHGKMDPPSWSSKMELVAQTPYHTFFND